MMTVEHLRNLTTADEWARGVGYARNGRVCFPDAAAPNDAVVRAAFDCRVQVRDGVRGEDNAQICSSLCPGTCMGTTCACGGEMGAPCSHIVAVLLSRMRGAGDLHAIRTTEAQMSTAIVPLPRKLPGTGQKPLIEVLLHWHPVLEQVRIIPRLIWSDPDGRNRIRIHPLSGDACPSIREADEVRAFFAQWPYWVPDETGALPLPREIGLAVLFSEIAPRFPLHWNLLYDKELEERKPLRESAEITLKLSEDRVRGMLSFSAEVHCDRLGITQEELLAHIRGQQRWLVDHGRYVEIENREQLRRLLQLAQDSISMGDAAGDRAELRTARMLAEMAECISMQQSGTLLFEGAIADLLEHFSTPAPGTCSSSCKQSPSLPPVSRQARPASLQMPLPDPPLPSLSSSLLRTLRPYQLAGIRWLDFLRTWRLGGILADDMGLGKTLQLLAFLSMRPTGRPTLILCPKTLLFNWLAEAKRFVPEMKVLLIHGPVGERERRLTHVPEFDLVITSYPLFQQDMEIYLKHRFDTCILDEAQMIRNPDARLTRQVKRIQADHRLAVTGTPMENSTMDLWSLFDFVMPGFLGSSGDFHVNQAGGGGARETLIRRIRPFMLRRVKGDVLTELPPRLEETIEVELTQNQLSLYQHTLDHLRRSLGDDVPEKTPAASSIELLAGLTRLRQICCHPGLLHPQMRGGAGLSGKMDLFKELIDSCLAGNHKVLVFSQFTGMLSLISKWLVHRRIPHATLTGQSNDRQSQIDAFNRDPGTAIFLISLKAGGYGLNLTAADTVILFDPWWNPMAEDQAADRSHRMGQTRPVTVYRLVTRNTIEERILLLQQRKREVFDEVVNGAGRMGTGLTLQDLRDLLA